jgi:hypothetical protein
VSRDRAFLALCTLHGVVSAVVSLAAALAWAGLIPGVQGLPRGGGLWLAALIPGMVVAVRRQRVGLPWLAGLVGLATGASWLVFTWRHERPDAFSERQVSAVCFFGLAWLALLAATWAVAPTSASNERLKP